MNNTQMTHIGMINSFNVLMGKASIDQVINAGIGVFAYVPDEDAALESINFMIFYFKEIEMYEKCAQLKEYVDETFNEDGTYKEKCCQCEMPEIDEYVHKIKCSLCNLRLKR